MKLIIALLLGISTLFGTELKLLTEEWPPYNYKHKGKIKGIGPAVVRAIQKEVGTDYNIELISWNRAYELTLHHENHVLFSAVRLEEREELFDWVGPISQNDEYLFESTKSPTGIKSLEDAKKVDLISAGAPNSADHIKLTSLGFTNLSKVDISSDSVHSLISGQVDLVSSNTLSMPIKLKQLGVPQKAISNTGVEVYSEPLYIVFNKNSDQKVVREWRRALESLKKSGRFATITKKALEEAYRNFGVTLD